MANQRILICDDSPAVHESLTAYLRIEGYEVDSVYDGKSALSAAAAGSYSLIVLDVMLPNMFGTDVCREIRKTSSIPILMLSARGEEYDRIIGLELGADDYVAKPFSPREVAARIRNILRRSEPVPAEAGENSTLGNIVLEGKSFTARIGGTVMELTAKEFDMLLYFSQNKNLVLSREQILNKVWGTNAEVDARAVDTCIKRLRKKIEQYKTGITVTALYGVGYKVEEDGSK